MQEETYTLTYRWTYLRSHTYCCVWRLWWWTRRVWLPGPERHGSVHHSESDSPAGHQTHESFIHLKVHLICFLSIWEKHKGLFKNQFSRYLTGWWVWESGWSIILCLYVMICAEIITLKMLLYWLHCLLFEIIHWTNPPLHLRGK